MGSGGKKGSTVVGYRYFMSLHMGVCRGPVDELSMIKVGDQRAWPLAGQNPVNDTQVDAINAPNLFGGDKKEGGIAGELSVMMGKEDQIADPYLASLLGGLVSGFRGVLSVFFDGMICALNPYPKTWKFRVVRNLKGWDGEPWHPELATVLVQDEGNWIRGQNPAHIIYECATNRSWGRGLARTRLDDASFLESAQTLHDEGFGLCLKWSRQDGLDQFVKSVIDHIGGVLDTDRQTGLLRLRLIRDNYDVDQVPTYTYDTGLLEISQDDTASKDNIVNEIIVKYTSVEAEGERSIRVHNLASIQSTGCVNSSTTEYPGIASGDLAVRVAQRDLKANSGAGRRYKVKVDRRGWKLAPGDVIAISAPDRGIDRVILRIGKTKDSGSGDGGIDLECVIDVFGLSAVSFVKPEPHQWVEPDKSAVPSLYHTLKEATYRDIFIHSRDSFNYLTDTTGSIVSFGLKPTSMSMGYELWSGATGENLVERSSFGFTPGGVLNGNLPSNARTMSLKLGVDLETVSIGTAFMIDDEIMRVDAMNISGRNATLNISRGCVDTIPAFHSANAIIYFFDEDVGYDSREYEMGEVVHGRLLTRTSADYLAYNNAPEDTVVMTARQARPYPPGNLLVNNVPFTDVFNVTTPIELKWAHRDRVIQQDQLFDHTAASMGPEPGVTYEIKVYKQSGGLLRTESGITSSSWVYDSSMAFSDGDFSNIRIELSAVRAGIYSRQTYQVTLHRV